MIKTVLNKKRFTHWYKPDGSPCHTIEGANGNIVKVDVRHAKRLGLFPSVTNILKLLAKENLETWKQEQLIKACMELQQGAQEDEAHYINRVVDCAFNKSETAIGFGLECHQFIQDVLQGQERAEYTLPKVTQSIIRDVLKREIASAVCEKEVTHTALKYAGRYDIRSVGHDGKSCLWDTKTQNTKAGEKVKIYDETVMQISAYDAIEPCTLHKCLIVSSTEPERVEVVTLEPDDIAEAFSAFKGLREVFKYVKGV